MRSSRRARRSQQGFLYIALLIGVAIIGIGLAATSEVWSLSQRREKEQELLFVGDQIRQAITHFYLQSPPTQIRFPMTLDELVNDVRLPDKPQHFLRRKYADPMTGRDLWGEVRLPGGQLVGVYSQSTVVPLKRQGFALRDKDFSDKAQYAEWVFRSPLPAANPLLKAGEGYSTPGTGGKGNPLPAPGTRGNLAPMTPFTPPPVRPMR